MRTLRKILIITICVLLNASYLLAANLYVDQLPAEPGSGWDGVDGHSYSGTSGNGKGYSTIKAALVAMNVGDKIYLRGDVYKEGYIRLPSKNGDSWQEGHYNSIQSYDGEWAILDGENNLSVGPDQGSGNWLAVIGRDGSLSYWKFERLEIRNGRATGGRNARGFHADGGPFIIKNCYIHDNYTTDYVDNIPVGISGHRWQNCIVEKNYFKNNGSLTKQHWNSAHIIMFGNYEELDAAINGVILASVTKNNEFRYNLFEGGETGIWQTKGQTYYTGRNEPDHPYINTNENLGCNTHHNIFRNLKYMPILINQDFLQVHNNIFESCYGGIYEGYSSTLPHSYKPAIYNNTMINNTSAGISFLVTNEKEEIHVPKQIYGYIYNNIIDGGYSTDVSSVKEEYSILDNKDDVFTNPRFDSLYISHNYSYRPAKHTYDPNGNKVLAIAGNKYTEDEYKSIKPDFVHYLNQYDAGNPLYIGTTGASKYLPNAIHLLSGSTTVANGGIGGKHPYLNGVVLPSYVGAVDPDNDEWVQTVLKLSELGSTSISTATDIKTFTIPGQTGSSVISTTNHTVAVTMPNGTDLTSLTPTISLSSGATINPASGTTLDFSSPQTYTVTAQDGTTKQVWTVSVTAIEAQFAGVLSKTGFTRLENDSALLTPAKNLRGTLQWQRSTDSLTWTDIEANLPNNALGFVPELTENFRLQITEGTCSPIYSNVVKVFSKYTTVAEYKSAGITFPDTNK